MHPTPEYPLVFHCGHAGTYPSIQEGAKLDELLERISQQKCPPCNRAMHYQPPAGATDAELYALWLKRQPQLTGHSAHRRLKGLSARYRACPDVCGPDLLRWMAENSGNSLIQQKAAAWIYNNNVPGYDWLLAKYYPQSSEVSA